MNGFLENTKDLQLLDIDINEQKNIKKPKKSKQENALKKLMLNKKQNLLLSEKRKRKKPITFSVINFKEDKNLKKNIAIKYYFQKKQRKG